MPIPERLLLDAWVGGPAGVSSRIEAGATIAGIRADLPREIRSLAPPKPADLRDWTDPRVGWGLILADDESVPVSDRARAIDAHEPLMELVAARGMAPVFRFRPDRPNSLRRDHLDGHVEFLDIAGSPFGVAAGEIPRYLLIHGPPTTIPWELQYVLNARFAVGRLDLVGAQLANYVNALLSGWPDDPPDPYRPVVWASEIEPDDMSAVMRATIGLPVSAALADDPIWGSGARLLDKTTGGATAATLAAALADARPGLIVTTSHGNMGPSDPGGPLTAAELGLLVDDDLAQVSIAGLTAAWDPYGGIWYSHACCSAGSSAETNYAGMFPPDSEVGVMIGRAAAVGSTVAAMPTALLGAPRPLRAFVGHVEPTFDLTIRERVNGQLLTRSLRDALYDWLYQDDRPTPIGRALWPIYEPIGSLATRVLTLQNDFNGGASRVVMDEAFVAQLSARDRMSTVILGDPTVALPL
jgi:hypothetical protein